MLYAEARSGAIPPRALNGGLYTGREFDAGSPWGNVPLVPETNKLITNGLTIGHTPPPGARAQTHGDRGGSLGRDGYDGPWKLVRVLNMTFPDTPTLRPSCAYTT